MQTTPERVRRADIEKMILWVELNPQNVAERCCPYSGKPICQTMLFSDSVEIEHILPFSKTLDDSLNNKTVALREANRIKNNQTPWEAKADFEAQGWNYEYILQRANQMSKHKRYRFGEDGYQKWLKGGEDKDGKGFLSRALNDTRYLSRVAKEYLTLICPQNTRVIPGQMTAQLRGQFGLNNILGLHGEKNREDHRHHAVDACVIGVTDQGMLQAFANAKQAKKEGLERLVTNISRPWPTYRDHVQRAVQSIWVSHKPDHGYEGAMHKETAYGLLGNGLVHTHKSVEGKRVHEELTLKVIEFTDPHATVLRNGQLEYRHGFLPNGAYRPYKGYKGDSNYCIEIVQSETGKWEGEVISTFAAYQIARSQGFKQLRHSTQSVSGKALVMRLIIDDFVKLLINDKWMVMRIATIKGKGSILMAAHQEANVDARNRDKNDPFSYLSKTASTLQKAKARRVTISPIGVLNDPGFKD